MKRYCYTTEELKETMNNIVKAVKEGKAMFTIPHFTRRAQICEVAHEYGLRVRGLTQRSAYLIITVR